MSESVRTYLFANPCLTLDLGEYASNGRQEGVIFLSSIAFTG